MPSPRHVINACISVLPYICASSAFSTFKIFPRSGSTAWNSRRRPCLADPPALSPSTMKTSDSAALVHAQSASLPGSTEVPSTVFRRTRSRAALAASAALAAAIALSRMSVSTLGRRCSSSSSSSHTMSLTIGRTSGLPSRVLVCPSNSASCIFTLMIAHSPSRRKSPLRLAAFSFTLPVARACALSTLEMANLSPSTWLPPLGVCTPLAKAMMLSVYMSEFHRSATSTCTPWLDRLAARVSGSVNSAVLPTQMLRMYSLIPPAWQKCTVFGGCCVSSTREMFSPALRYACSSKRVESILGSKRRPSSLLKIARSGRK
mmetsp:Transcript_5938/g.15094  ORF Transcript_5938/g.15094 Transcript_5938/m.15094 type:complete len:318 (-) Transcript_5938:554-1507(-)